MKYIIQLIFGGVLIFIGYLLPDELKPELVGAGITILLSVVFLTLTYDVYANYKRLGLVFRCFYLSLKGEKIRFSMAYLYLIKVNDKYLLVKNSSWNLYQLVGGKYKRNTYTALHLKNLGAEDDLKMQTSGIKKDDLVVCIPAKNAIKFLDWFNTKEDREISHWREFYEELVSENTRVLKRDEFPYINYNLKGTIRTPLKRSERLNCWEILQYDILEILPTEKQYKELETLYSLGDTDYIKWADAKLIKNLGYDCRNQMPLYDIGKHTKWALNMKWTIF